MISNFLFSGRVGRLEYFVQGIAHYLVACLILGFYGLVLPLGLDHPLLKITWGFCFAAWFFLFWMNLASFVKRFHDLDKGGWELLVLLIPFYNLYIMLLINFKAGTQGPNRFGLQANDYKINPIALANTFIPLIVALYLFDTRLLPLVYPADGQPTTTFTLPRPSSDRESLIIYKGLKDAPVKSFVEFYADLNEVNGQKRIGEKILAWSVHQSPKGEVNVSPQPYNPNVSFYNPKQHNFHLGRIVFDKNGSVIPEDSILSEEELKKAFTFHPFVPKPEIDETEDGSRTETTYTIEGSIAYRKQFDKDNKLLLEEEFVEDVLRSKVLHNHPENYIEVTLFNEEASQKSRVIRDFNESNLEVQRRVYDAEDNFVKQLDIVYNDSNYVAEEVWTDKDGNTTPQLKVNFGAENRVLDLYRYFESGALYSETHSDFAADKSWIASYKEYDIEGELMYERVTSFAPDGGVKSSDVVLSDLAKERNLVVQPIFPTTKTVPTYKDGRLQKMDIVDANEVVIAKLTYDYNQKGDLNGFVKYKNDAIEGIVECDYFYDRYSNWTQRTCIPKTYIDGELTTQYDSQFNEVTYRELSYY